MNALASNLGKSGARSLIGASIPRSGHHFLQTLLSQYFGDEMFYCEFYNQADCCKSVPCTRRGAHAIVYQKSHDRQGELRKDVSDALYIVQYREPVGEALSDRELDTIDHIGRRSLNYRLTPDHYAWWLASKAVYYREFHDKWFAPRLDNAVYLDYSLLSSRPVAAIAAIVERVEGPVDERRIEAAVEASSSMRAGVSPRKGGAAYSPRSIEDSRFFERDLLGAFESYVLARCPNYGFESRLSGSFLDHPFYGLALLQDKREPLPAGEVDRLDAALRRAPNHPEVLFRVARRFMAQENAAAAIGTLEQLLACNPFFSPAYELLLAAYRMAGREFPAEKIGGDALLACSDSPPLLLEIGAAYLSAGMRVNAVAALSLAAALDPANHRANFLLAKILADEKKWAQAEEYAQKALRLKPESKGGSRLLARIRGHLPRHPSTAGRRGRGPASGGIRPG